MHGAAVPILAACILAGCVTAGQPPAGIPTPETAPTENAPTTDAAVTLAPVGAPVFRTLAFDYQGRTQADAGVGVYPVGGPALPKLADGYNIDYRFWTTARVLLVNATLTWEARSDLTRELKLQLNADEPHTFQITGPSPLQVHWNITDVEAVAFGLGVWAPTDLDAVVGGAHLTHEQDFYVNGTLFVQEIEPLPAPDLLRSTLLLFEGRTKTGVCGPTPPCQRIEPGDRHPFETTSQPVELRGTLKRIGDRQPCLLALSLWGGEEPTHYFPHAEGNEEVPFAFDLRGYLPGTSFTILTSCDAEHSGAVGSDPELPQDYVIEATLTEAT